MNEDLNYVSSVEIPDIKLEENVKNPKPVKDVKPLKEEIISNVGSKWLKKINRAKELFPIPTNNVIKGKKLDKLSDEELEIVYKNVRASIANRPTSSSSFIKTGYFMALGLAETFAPYANMNLKGLKDGIEKREDINEILDEISLDYENYDIPMPPETKLAMITLNSIYLTNKYNTDEQYRLLVNAGFNEELKSNL